MKLLLDECLPPFGLSASCARHEVSTVPEMGWRRHQERGGC